MKTREEEKFQGEDGRNTGSQRQDAGDSIVCSEDYS